MPHRRGDHESGTACTSATAPASASRCIVGEKSYVAYDVQIGDLVKINASVYVCAGVTIEDFCMISAHTVFTNDRFPRAGNLDLTGLETSEPDRGDASRPASAAA